MMNDTNVKLEISALQADISRYRLQTQEGSMIDIATLPERVMDIHRRVQIAAPEHRPELSLLLTNVIGALDELSRDVQTQHDLVTRNIDVLEGPRAKE
ncbi:hypothetical protein NBZ79_11380 [Sneathiella marina]|uniref:Uncharacterized protein n=1 Tax=Sneathiella marina TaxID=2950108 RepID=A0ABY4W3A6_9PROT|nr:hypothetical protein [Sneathiella marina]USG59779.1 hypothetical protein NBZ79_11380 [Sneathiella marina]